MLSNTFERFAGYCGVLAGVAGLVYLVSVVTLRNPAALLPSLALLVVGILASAVVVALYQRLRAADEGFALWALLLGVGGAGGAAVHAAFDLANAIQPPTGTLDVPSPVDPRGFLTFAIAGLSAILFAWLILRSRSFPQTLAYLGLLAGVLLIALYIFYMITLNAFGNPIVLILILATGVLQPIWYSWLGVQLMRGAPTMR